MIPEDTMIPEDAMIPEDLIIPEHTVMPEDTVVQRDMIIPFWNVQSIDNIDQEQVMARRLEDIVQRHFFQASSKDKREIKS
jgi:hypothetical protein